MDVVGYDDNMTITNDVCTESTTGAFIVRNSWGVDQWGVRGYGWLPYKYVTEGLAIDWWSLIEADWVDLGQFGL
jgi:C1A family cysteine protease